MKSAVTSHAILLATGWFFGLAWLYRLIENIVGMRHVDDIADPAFDERPEYNLTNAQLPRLRVVVPARNEERSIEECLGSLLAVDYPELEIVAIDDRSTDATGAIMDRMARTAGRRLRVLHVAELPPGWLGKTHAMALGANFRDDALPEAKPQSTRAGLSEWILFTDGDIFFHPASLRRAVAYAEARRADHFGLAPSLILFGFGERTLMSFVMTMFTLVRRPWRIADPKSKDSVGMGAFNLIRREAYMKLGGYEAFRLDVLDDLNLGAAVKRAGFSQRMAFGRGLVRLRWGRGAFGILGNMTKNLFALVRFQVWRAVAMICGLLFFALGPFAGIYFATGAAKAGFAVAIVAIFGLYANMGRFNEISPIYAITYPLSSLLIAFAIARSTIFAVLSGGIVWRGTKYPLGELRRHIRP